MRVVVHYRGLSECVCAHPHVHVYAYMYIYTYKDLGRTQNMLLHDVHCS